MFTRVEHTSWVEDTHTHTSTYNLPTPHLDFIITHTYTLMVHTSLAGVDSSQERALIKITSFLGKEDADTHAHTHKYTQVLWRANQYTLVLTIM